MNCMHNKTNDCRSADGVVASRFLSRGAMHKRGLSRRATRVVSVRPSRSCILSKRINIFFTIGLPHHSSFSVPNVMAIFRRRPPDWGKNHDFRPISACFGTDHCWTVACRQHFYDGILFITESLDVTLKTTEQNLIVCSGKSEAAE